MASIDNQLRSAELHLAQTDPVMGEVITRYGPCALAARRREPFQVLCSSIISQQISSRAADTIQARVVAAFGEKGRIVDQRLATADFDALRACGLSQNKAKWLQHLGAAHSGGTLDFAKLRRMDDEAAIEVLDALPGIGRWTAEMFLIFHLERPDVLSGGDLGIRKAIQVEYGLAEMPVPQKVLEIGEPWRPHRSLASLYLWESLANVPAE